MVDMNEITQEQRKKIKNYNNFYNKTLINIFGLKATEMKKLFKYEPYYKAYFNIVKRTAHLINKLNINDPIRTSIIFEYLLWNGYLSKNHQLSYSVSDRINNPAIAGADIMRGKSVCLNNAIMLTDILRELGIKAYTIGCDVKEAETPIKLEYRPNIERDYIEEKIKDKIFTKIIGATFLGKIGNHAVTIFPIGETMLLSDPTSLAFLEFTDFLKAKYIGSNTEVAIKPWLSIYLEQMTKDELDNLVKRSFLYSDSENIPIKSIKDISELVMKLCEQIKTPLERFYESNQSDISTICKTLSR